MAIILESFIATGVKNKIFSRSFKFVQSAMSIVNILAYFTYCKMKILSTFKMISTQHSSNNGKN